ncbi:MAG: hypothetical protein HXS46_21030 [Theionarchaea archaeon]|nr:hypothetical protein [Theionarchaea archaeon]
MNQEELRIQNLENEVKLLKIENCLSKKNYGGRERKKRSRCMEKTRECR